MRNRHAIFSFLSGAWAAGCLLGLGGCADFSTGQDAEPDGALTVTRLTLLDSDQGRSKSHGGIVFTDTSVPADCTSAPFKDLAACTSDPFGDKYGVLKSPPNPDSARRLRVVFNKAPLLLGGMPLEPVPTMSLPSALVLADPTVLRLVCMNCSQDAQGNQGVPLSYNSLQITGTDLSPDPSRFAYGPGLQMEVLTECGTAATDPCALAGIAADPYRALEPGATYSVVLNPALSARRGDGSDTLAIDDATRSLLRFTTEPFQILTVGIGDGKDNRPAGTGASGDGSAANPYRVDRPLTGSADQIAAVLDNAGAIQLGLNAAVDESLFTAGTATATVTVGAGASLDVPVTLSNATGGPGACVFGSKRKLYIAPTAGTWLAQPAADAVVRLTLRGSELRDLSQAPRHEPGKGVHAIAKEIHVQARLLAEPAGTDYSGVKATTVVPPNEC